MNVDTKKWLLIGGLVGAFVLIYLMRVGMQCPVLPAVDNVEQAQE